MERRDALGLALGCAASLAGIGHRARPFASRRPGPVALWAADRAGHAVYGLDADALVVLRAAVTAPMRVVTDGDGACAVESAVESRFDGPRQWLRIDRDGRASNLTGPPVRARATSLPGEVGERAPGPVSRWVEERRADGSSALWSLATAGRSEARLERWVRRPREPWRRAFLFALPWTARALAARPGGVWVVGDRAPIARFVTSTGRVVIERRFDDVDGADDACIASRASGGGVWIAACGALVRLDRRGRRMPGQGGFAHLASVTLAASTERLAVSRSGPDARPR
ncbi:MAG: hypothetical protein AAGA20_14955 [Planctomycetota bacterium]